MTRIRRSAVVSFVGGFGAAMPTSTILFKRAPKLKSLDHCNNTARLGIGLLVSLLGKKIL